MTTSKQILDAVMELTKTVNTVDKNVAVQKSEISNLSTSVEEIKDEQKRQNGIVEEHERRSTASEGRQTVIEEQHEVFKVEHDAFKTRLTVAEKPSLILQNIWKAIITLGTGAGAMYGILKFLEQLK